jgi:hypothetical protein
MLISHNMETIDVSRPSVFIGGGKIETVEPFYIREVLQGVFPHEKDGVLHKGNMVVTNRDDYGFTGEARCVMKSCGVMVEVRARIS